MRDRETNSDLEKVAGSIRRSLSAQVSQRDPPTSASRVVVTTGVYHVPTSDLEVM
jgi:hypothetical protein